MVETGEGGIDEFTEELNKGQVGYGNEKERERKRKEKKEKKKY